MALDRSRVSGGTDLLLQHPLLLLDLGEPLEQFTQLVVGQLGGTLTLRTSSSRLVTTTRGRN